MTMPSRPEGPSSLARFVGTCTRHAWVTVLFAILLAAAALLYTARNFAITTDTAELISTDLDWRKRELAFNAAFPQLDDLILVVIDGGTPELADAASQRLATALRGRPTLFRTVRQPDGGPFLERNGLLMLPEAEVAEATSQLVRAQPFLGPLALDPSLRGVLGILSTALEGVERGDTTLANLQPGMNAFARTFENVLAGQTAFFSWRSLITDTAPTRRETRRILLVQPVMDFTALQPGAAAGGAIRRIAAEEGMTPAQGVTVRLTGPVPLADEEFATLAEDAELVTAVMMAALIGILWLAVRAGRMVVAILITTLLGLVMTTGLGLLVTGRFNLISVAFIPLFVGLGIDFNIQFSIRFLAERVGRPDTASALAAAGQGVGHGLALSSAAIGLGFFAFLPTSYLGVAELGAIAGLGMIIAFALSVTLLPALLMLLASRSAGMAEPGYPGLAPVEAWLRRRRGLVLASGGVTAIVCLALLPSVRFDFNPLHLRSARVESMATLHDLMADPDRSPNSLTLLAATPEEARTLARRLEELREVGRTVTLADFVPAAQDEKLALIADAGMFLTPVFEEIDSLPPPSDADARASLVRSAAALRAAARQGTGPAAEAAGTLAGLLEALQDASPEVRAKAAEAVVMPLRVVLEQTRALLSAGPLTLEDLPDDLKADWVARDGRIRVQVFAQSGAEDDTSLGRFAAAVQRVEPEATGVPISIRAAGDMIVTAFLQAGLFAGIAITLLLAVVLRRARDVILTMVPVLLSGLLTLASCAALDLPLNFANIIALPLLFGVGVAFNIYFVMAWRNGEADLLQSSLTRAVVFSALTTATAFGALWLSSHPGTASMGRLLMLSLGWELLVTLLFRPALLARPARA
jgi:hopanoid biosynthesis associated RND transporter like protein HpnN